MAAFLGEFGRQRRDQLVVERVDLVERDDDRLIDQVGAIGFELVAHDAIARRDILVVRVDEDVATSYRIVRNELEAYGADLLDKPVVVALNKIDTLDDELIAALSAELAEASGHPVMALSGASGAGVEAVLDKLLEAVAGDVAGEDPDGDADAAWSPV